MKTKKTIVVVWLLSCVQLLVTPWTAACQAFLSFTISQSLLRLMSILFSWWCHPTISSSVSPFSCPQSFPASGSFPISWLCASGGQSIETSVSASVLPLTIQDWFRLGWTGWMDSLKSKGLSGVFSNTTVPGSSPGWSRVFKGEMASATYLFKYSSKI